MNKHAFFAAIRRDLFPAGLNQEQVSRIETLLDAMSRAGWPLAYAAYALGTAHHETARWKHLKELGGDAYFKRMYDKTGERPHIAKQLGNTEVGDGARYPGRGYSQITGRANYRKAGNAIGIDLLKEPTKAEDPAIAARILVWGMETGAYTGKACRDYLDKTPPDYVNARRIINGTDRAAIVAGYAKTFASALLAAKYGDEPAPIAVETLPKAPVLPDALKPNPAQQHAQAASFWSALASAIAAFFKGKPHA